MTTVLTLASGPLAAAQEPPKDASRRVFVADGLETLDARTERGIIDVEGADRLAVQVDLVDAVDAHCELVARPDLETKTLRLEVRAKGLLAPKDCRTGLRIELPARMSVRASSERGDVVAMGLDQDLDVEAGAGDVRLADLRGRVRVNAGTGAVSGRLPSPRQIVVRTGTGRVRLRGLTGGADVKTGSGDIRLEWPAKPAADADVSVELKTGSGSAAVYLPAGSAVAARLKTDGGSIVNELGDAPKAGFKVSMTSGSGNLAVLKNKREDK